MIDTFGGVDIVVSNAGIASSAPIGETTLAEWNRNQACCRLATSSSPGRHSGRWSSRASAARSCSSPPRTRLVAGPNASAYSTAKAAELHLARCLAAEGGSASIRVNTVNPDAVLQGSRIWDSSWRTERADAYGIEPDDLDEHYRKRTVLGVNVLPEDIAQRGDALRLPRAVRQEHRQPAQRRRWRNRGFPALTTLRVRSASKAARLPGPRDGSDPPADGLR